MRRLFILAALATVAYTARADDHLFSIRVEELSLRGIVRTRKGPVALLAGPAGCFDECENVASFYRPAAHVVTIGDQTYDGKLIAIGTDSVTFRMDDGSLVKLRLGR